MPSHVLALVVFALVYRGRFGSGGEEFAHVLAHLSFIHVWFPATFGSLSGPLWTLGVEVQFDALIALVAPIVVRRPALAYATCVGIAIVYRGTVALARNDSDFGWIDQLPAVLDVFGAGFFAAAACVHVRPRATAAHVRPATSRRAVRRCARYWRSSPSHMRAIWAATTALAAG